MKAYLASESEEEEEEDTSGERAIAERYKSLLLGSARAKVRISLFRGGEKGRCSHFAVSK